MSRSYQILACLAFLAAVALTPSLKRIFEKDSLETLSMVRGSNWSFCMRSMTWKDDCLEIDCRHEGSYYRSDKYLSMNHWLDLPCTFLDANEDDLQDKATAHGCHDCRFSLGRIDEESFTLRVDPPENARFLSIRFMRAQTSYVQMPSKPVTIGFWHKYGIGVLLASLAVMMLIRLLHNDYEMLEPAMVNRR